MATVEKTAVEVVPTEGRGRLLRVLGVVFGLAVTVGITIGMGILRTPGEVAQQLPHAWLFLGAWALGGVYALFGAVSVAELGTMIPRSGGFYVFARRALGEYPGFVVGWSDWLSTCGTVAAVVLALQGIIYTYDGWYSTVYFGEEVRDTARSVPRAMVGSVLLVIVVYLLFNAALLYVLPVEQLAGQKLAAGAAARGAFSARGAPRLPAGGGVS